MREIRTLSLTVLATGAIGFSQAHGVINPGFEDGTGTDAAFWEEIVGANGTVERSTAMPNSGTYSAFIGFDNTSSPVGGAHFIQQNSGFGGIADPLLNYDFGFFAKVDSTDFTDHNIFAQLQWLDQSPGGSGFISQIEVPLIADGINTSYQQFGATNIDVPDNANSYLVRFQIAHGGLGGVSNGLYVDDITLDAIGAPPPPAFPNGVNILENPGFELGTNGDAASWTELALGANGQVVRSDLMPNEGEHHAYMSFDNTNTPAPGPYFIEQNPGAGTIDDSVNYDLAFAAKVDSLDFTGTDFFVELQWLDQSPGGAGFLGNELISLVGLGIGTEYKNFIFNDLEVPAGADSYILRFQASPGAVPGIVNGLSVDNAYLGQVPEPASLALLAISGLVLGARRRA